MRNSGVRTLTGGGGGLYIASLTGTLEGTNGVGTHCRVGASQQSTLIVIWKHNHLISDIALDTQELRKKSCFRTDIKWLAISVMHCEKLNPTTTSTWSSKQLPSLPKQFLPFAHRPGCSGYPLYPALHLQPNDPYLLMQTAFESQSSKSILHSSRSYQWKNHVDFINSHIIEIPNETISFFKEIPILHQNQSFFLNPININCQKLKLKLKCLWEVHMNRNTSDT